MNASPIVSLTGPIRVELVDIEPDELVKRLQAGKVYQERQAKQALQNFFTVENLAALREIAMRRTADQLNRTALQEGREKSAKAGEHILICLSSSPSNPKVIRTAARMAEPSTADSQPYLCRRRRPKSCPVTT